MKYISMIPPLAVGDIIRGRADGARPAIDAGTLPFRYGRDALRVGLDLFGIGTGDEVLVPAVICEVVLDAFSQRGARLGYYGLSDSLAVEVEEIEARIGPETKAIYVNHALGRPMQIKPLRALCNRRGVVLIEDCAHALGGATDDCSVGVLADFSIYSYRKFFALPDGGGLHVQQSARRHTRLPKRAGLPRQVAGAGKLFALGLASSIGLPSAAWRERSKRLALSEVGGAGDLPSAEVQCRMSAISEWLLSRADMNEMVSRRRQNFAYCLDKVRSLASVEPLFKELSSGQVPYSFPVLVDDRDSIVRRAAAEAILLEPTFAPVDRRRKGLINPEERFDSLDAIAGKLLSVPVHQGLSPADLDRVFDVLRHGVNDRSGG
jgi:dTDP-4-amino-4,6-dideoxygalactose transaminase